MMSGGTVESGVRMQLERDQRVNATLPGAVGGVQAPSAQVRPFSAAVDISASLLAAIMRHPAKLLNDVETIQGTSKMHRRANALFAARLLKSLTRIHYLHRPIRDDHADKMRHVRSEHATAGASGQSAKGR